MQVRKGAAVAALMVAMAAQNAQAGMGPHMGPKESWGDAEKYEYYIGQLGSALRLCGYFELSANLKELADLTPYGREGWRSMLAFDDIRGGRCGSYAESGREILDHRVRLWNHLIAKYDCAEGDCRVE